MPASEPGGSGGIEKGLWGTGGKGEMGTNGADRDRTGDPLLAKQVLSQLSYRPDAPKHNPRGAGPTPPPPCLCRAHARQGQRRSPCASTEAVTLL
jgi:hypothetical protein